MTQQFRSTDSLMHVHLCYSQKQHTPQTYTSDRVDKLWRSHIRKYHAAMKGAFIAIYDNMTYLTLSKRSKSTKE